MKSLVISYLLESPKCGVCSCPAYKKIQTVPRRAVTSGSTLDMEGLSLLRAGNGRDGSCLNQGALAYIILYRSEMYRNEVQPVEKYPLSGISAVGPYRLLPIGF